MRRIDAIAIALGFFLSGGVIYAVLLGVGIEGQKAGIYTQAVLIGGLILWLLSYIFRVLSHDMTYHQQIKDYEEAMIQKRWESLSPEEREKLQAEVERDKITASGTPPSES
ncbi:MAG: DUF3007 family protein [Microcystaceae cyanobacterium]